MSLETEQKMALFENISLLPELKDIKKYLKKRKVINDIKKQKPENIVSKGILKRMRSVFKEDGLTEEQINKKLKIFCENKKQLEIKALEKE